MTDTIRAELIESHRNMLDWAHTQDAIEFLAWKERQDQKCAGCVYVCKGQWYLVGEQSSRTQSEIMVGPDCPVLWQFSPYNKRAISISERNA